MKYAIIRLLGKQYKVEEGREFTIQSLKGKDPQPEVLLLVSDKNVNVGTPLVDKAKIVLKVVTEKEKGEKITVQTYKAKSRYRRKIGFRPTQTRLLVESIS